MRKERFGSRFALIAAAIGMAVGTGNIWRFPRVVAEWGGGTFLVALIVANLVWAIPVLMAESLMGSKSRLGTVGAFRDFMGQRFAWMGAFMGLVTVGILCYYSVVSGWSLRYFFYSLSGAFTSPDVDTQVVWDEFVTSPLQTVSFHLLSILVVGAIVIRGLKRGFEGVLQVAIPSLFVILVILAVRAVTLPGAEAGLSYLFQPDWTEFGDARVWLEAFTQMAFSTGAGWGLYLTYSVYARKREDMASNAVIVTSGNLLASLLAGAAVLCTLFALSSVGFVDKALAAGNEGLAFIYFARMFTDMPGAVVFAPLFFLALTLAAFSSLIAMVELATRNVMDMGASRRRAVVGVVIVGFVVGLPSAFSLDVFKNQDFVWGVGLLVSGLLAAVAMMRYGVDRARTELVETAGIPIGAWWAWCIRLFPVMFVLLFGWWVYQSIAVFAPDTWWNPFTPFSIATLALQWGALFVVVYAANSYLGRKVLPGPMSGGEQEP